MNCYTIFKTKEVKFDSILIADINKVIDKNHIDLSYAHWDNDVQQDHQSVGKVAL